MSTQAGGLPSLKPIASETDSDNISINITLIPEHADGDYKVQIESVGVLDTDEAMIDVLESIVENLKSNN